jgi:hypothetical protein
MSISTQDRTIDLTSIGGIKFEEQNHKYTNKDGVKYNGVTTLLKNYEHDFNTETGAINSAIKYVIIEEFGEEKFNILKRQCKTEQLNKLKGSISKDDEKHIFGHNFLHEKLHSITNKYPLLKNKIEENRVRFLKEWKESSDEAIKIGSLEHDLREQNIKKDGYWFNGVHYKYIEGKNILNVTTDDIIVIPECLVWNHNVKLGGLADIFLFNKGYIKVHDYKTNESIEMESFLGKKMKGCCSRLMDSSYFHYSLQLRIYQKMALDLRKDFKQSENYIIHTKSEKYNRTEDNLIKCFEVENEVENIFNDLYKQAN